MESWGESCGCGVTHEIEKRGLVVGWLYAAL